MHRTVIEHRRKSEKWVHGKRLAVLIEIDRIEAEEDPWSLYLDPQDVRRLEAAQHAADIGDADIGDVAEASRYGRVFELREVTV